MAVIPRYSRFFKTVNSQNREYYNREERGPPVLQKQLLLKVKCQMEEVSEKCHNSVTYSLNGPLLIQK